MHPSRNCRRPSARCALLAAALLTVAAPGSGRAAGIVSTIDYGTGARAVARAGVAGAVVAELIDSPPLLAEPASQSFIDVAFAQLESLSADDSIKRRYVALRARLRPRGGAFDRARALQTLQGLTVDVLGALPPPRDRLFLLGTAAQQADYNARVLREAETDRQLRGLLGSVAEGDDLFPGVGSLRTKLADASPEDWKASAALAHAIVVAILGSADAAPFPPAPGIWTILVRYRAAGSGAEKRDALHASLDVVWFDGRHRTFAGYPGGGTDFVHDADKLDCLTDREPQTGTLRTVPLAPPPGLSYDAMAFSFERSCAEYEKLALPYLVSQVSDDKLISAMLSAAHIDPGSAK